ncbi:hypothetical protein EAF04_007738 [Stromatinia cepivora]|nr:hypothetical protein EAF04_007738 [Stromatinia cepivora]
MFGMAMLKSKGQDVLEVIWVFTLLNIPFPLLYAEIIWKEIPVITRYNECSSSHSENYTEILQCLQRIHQVSLEITFSRNPSPFERITNMRFLLRDWHCYMFKVRRYRKNKVDRFKTRNYFWREYLGYREDDKPSEEEEMEREMVIRGWLDKIIWTQGKALRVFGEKIFEGTGDQGKILSKGMNELLQDINDVMEDPRESSLKESAMTKSHDATIMDLFKRHYVLYSQVVDSSFDFQEEDDLKQYYDRETQLVIGVEVCQMTEELVEYETKRRWGDGDQALSFWERGDIYFPMADMRDEKWFDLDLDPQMAVLWKEQWQKMTYDGSTNRFTDVSDVPTTNFAYDHWISQEEKLEVPFPLDFELDNLGIILKKLYQIIWNFPKNRSKVPRICIPKPNPRSAEQKEKPKIGILS